MYGSRPQQKGSSISVSILRCAFHYATLLGVIWFGIVTNRANGRLIARNGSWYKWFCLLSRILMCCIFCESFTRFMDTMSQDSHVKILVVSQSIGCLICAIIILVIQICYGKQVLRVVNSFLKLFQRVQALPGCQDMGFGGQRELSLLLLKVSGLLYELFYMIPALFSELDILYALIVLCKMYIAIGANMICNICFVAYLSIGALYDQLNSYVRHELRIQLRGLQQPNGVPTSRRQLKAAACHMDESLAIYDEIQRVACDFQQLVDIPLCFILLFGFLSMALVSFFIMLNKFQSISLWLLAIKLFMDILLLTLAIHGAGSSSRVVRRLSLENYYISQENEWHTKLEMFLSRLNYNEFRVCPLGLFEVSNELILVFLSGLVTYLTYIIEYGMQSKQI